MRKTVLASLILLVMVLGLTFQPIQEAYAYIVYQNLTDSCTNAYVSSTWTNNTLIYVGDQYYPSHSYARAMTCGQSGSGVYYDEHGYLVKTFDNTNATQFLVLNITLWLYIQVEAADQFNFMININDRIIFGDCYVGGDEQLHQNDVFAVMHSRTGSVLTDFTDIDFALPAQFGFSTYYYTGGFNKLSLQLFQTESGYTFRYYHNDVVVRDQVIWATSYFTTPLEAWNVTIGVNGGTWVDDISIQYNYQTTPIVTPWIGQWDINQAWNPSESPMAINKTYTNIINTLFATVGASADLDIWISSTHIGNYTTGANGTVQIPMIFAAPGSYTMTINAYDNGTLVDTLNVAFTVAGGSDGGTGGFVWPSFTWAGVVGFVPTGLVLAIISGAFMNVGQKMGDHALAGLLLGAGVGLVICTTYGLIPVWFDVLVFTFAGFGAYFWLRS